LILPDRRTVETASTISSSSTGHEGKGSTVGLSSIDSCVCELIAHPVHTLLVRPPRLAALPDSEARQALEALCRGLLDRHS